MKLIVNADDFGYSRGVNYGILDAHQQGIVRSATLMPNMPGFGHAVEIAKQNPRLGVGIHLVLTCGAALTGTNRTITDQEGNFIKLQDFQDKLSELDMGEVEREYEAQIKKVLEAGVEPTHLDSHHHTHMSHNVFDVFVRMARKYRLPMRLCSKEELPESYKEEVRSPDVFVPEFFGENANREFLINLLQRMGETDGVVEIMCHPAYVDQTIMAGSSYNVQRTKELEALRDKDVLRHVKEGGIDLIDFRDLP